MRKHFLLLFLMALLPLAGWAQTDITGYQITLSAANATYDGTSKTPTVTLTEGLNTITSDNFNVEWFKDGESLGAAPELINVSETGYSVKVTPDITHTYGDLAVNTKKFWVLKAVTAVNNVPAVIANQEYSAAGYDLVATKPIVNYGTVKYLATNSDVAPAADAEKWSTTPPHETKPGKYYVYIKVDEEANWAAIAPYSIGNVTINGEDITVFTAPERAMGLKYTGEAQDLLATSGTATGGTVMYKVGTGEWSTTIPQGIDAGDYTVSWMVKGDATHNDKPAEALTATTIAVGTPVISGVTGAANLTYNKQDQPLLATNGSVTLGVTLTYDVSFNGAAAENKATADLVQGKNAGTYTITPKVAATANTKAVNGTPFNVVIAQKDLYLSVLNQTKVYDGTAFTVGLTAGVQYNGLIAGDALDADAVTAYVDAGTHTDKGEYKITTTGGDNTNYNIHRLETGKFTITARPITLTAKDKTITFGNAVPAFDVTTTYIDIQAAGKDVGLVSGESATVLGAIKSVGLKEAKTDIGTYTGNIIITKKDDAATLAPNYEISVVAGTYKINPAGGYTLIAENKTVTYGQAYEFTFIAPNGEPVKDVEFEVYKGEEKLEANPTDFGTYTIKVHPDTYAPANFGGEEAVITYIDGTLTIEKKELKIVPQTQTLRVGKKATDLVASMVDFDGVVAGDEGKIDYTLDFKGATVDGTGKLTKVETIDDGIKAVLSAPAEGNRNANYTLSAASVGKLIVVNNATLVLGNNEASDLADLSTYDGAKVTVKINLAARNGRKLPAATTRNWEKETWVTLTLPFDIDVATLSQKLGYAIVNVIDPEATVIDGTGSKFYGKLTMKGGNGKNDVLAANKPILVKIADDIANVGVAGEVDFGTQTIVAPADEAARTVDAGKGAKFIGTYASKTVTKDDDAALWFMMGNTPKWAYIGTSSDNSWTIKPFEAYIDMSGAPAAPANMTFYFEDIDGSVTAIKSISADNLNGKIAEGMYNLNGMKLNSVPTQKGVYIVNGKKVVIK